MRAVSEIKITTELRPCFVNGRPALFHRWADSARPAKAYGKENDESAGYHQLHSVQGIVEYEDGTVDRVWPSVIKFLPHAQFAETDWYPLPWTMEENKND